MHFSQKLVAIQTYYLPCSHCHVTYIVSCVVPFPWPYGYALQNLIRNKSNEKKQKESRPYVC